MPNVLQPASWTKPKGYVNGIAARGRQVFIAGQIGWDGGQMFRSDDLVAQIEQALANIVAVLREAGGEPHHVVRLTWYILDKRAYLAQQAEIGRAYRAIMGRHFPAMTMVQVAALIEDRALVEIEATAVVPD
jgi:enamine deaminase RidA (YjgF/YER057c/UK114 family)